MTPLPPATPGTIEIEPPEPPRPARVEAPVRPESVGLAQPQRGYSVEPHYPELARRAGVGGIVILEAVAARDGTVERLTVLRDPPRSA
jgi:outer membrane biosynthesis protein TonB